MVLYGNILHVVIVQLKKIHKCISSKVQYTSFTYKFFKHNFTLFIYSRQKNIEVTCILKILDLYVYSFGWRLVDPPSILPSIVEKKCYFCSCYLNMGKTHVKTLYTWNIKVTLSHFRDRKSKWKSFLKSVQLKLNKLQFTSAISGLASIRLCRFYNTVLPPISHIIAETRNTLTQASKNGRKPYLFPQKKFVSVFYAKNTFNTIYYFKRKNFNCA